MCIRDSVSGLEHHNTGASFRQALCGRETRNARTDNRDTLVQTGFTSGGRRTKRHERAGQTSRDKLPSIH